jgi:hypothetical protein
MPSKKPRQLEISDEAKEIAKFGYSAVGAGKKTVRTEREAYAGYLIGGGYRWHNWIDPESFQLCEDHTHEAPDRVTMVALVPRICIPQFFKAHCLVTPFLQYEAGTRCLSYNRGVHSPYLLFVRTAELVAPEPVKGQGDLF